MRLLLKNLLFTLLLPGTVAGYLPWLVTRDESFTWGAGTVLAFVLFYRPFVRLVREAVTTANKRRTTSAELESRLQIGPPSQAELLRQSLAKAAVERPEGVAQTVRVWLNETEG